MSQREKITAHLEDALFLDPPETFDECIIGIARRAGGVECVAYDEMACIRALMRDNEMDREEAEEWFEHNTVAAWVGERTPLFVDSRMSE